MTAACICSAISVGSGFRGGLFSSALFIGSTGTRSDRAGETIEAIDVEVRRMAEQGPTQKELDEAKSYLKGSQMLALDTSSKLAQVSGSVDDARRPWPYAIFGSLDHPPFLSFASGTHLCSQHTH